MIFTLLVWLWMWDRVSTQCDGTPETIAYYSLRMATRIGTEVGCVISACCDLSNDPSCDLCSFDSTCITFTPLSPWFETTRVPQSAIDPISSAYDLPDPPLHSIYYLDIEAVDLGGQSSLSCP